MRVAMDQMTGSEQSARDSGSSALAALTEPTLGPLFRRPTRLGVDSAWYGHVPFAGWIVRAARPRSIVELGTHAGVSYAAFCEAVLQEGLDARCYAIDTWQGDEHAGFYGESVFEELREFHDARYGGFSRLIRCSFDAALSQIADHSFVLLHIDGRHR
ncbi:MAG: class I SAM-dependent methyltransferase, partial [Rhodospirillales bacterium]|nr:class I SAM-dependent methyltransferase [Rhodospirillales bacterium]